MRGSWTILRHLSRKAELDVSERSVDIVKVLSLAMESAARARGIDPSDEVRAAALRWEIYASLQNLLDSLAMIVADLGLRKPSSYGELGPILFERGVLDAEETELVKRAAATRNVVAHAYRAMGVEELKSVEQIVLQKIEGLARKLVGYVKDAGLDPSASCPSVLAEVFGKSGVQLAYLIGSRAREVFREDSDYDFAVLFGRDATVEDEVRLAIELAPALEVPVDVVNVAALDRADLELAYRVLKEGRLEYMRDENTRRAWERDTFLEVLDSRDIYDLYASRVRKERG